MPGDRYRSGDCSTDRPPARWPRLGRCALEPWRDLLFHPGSRLMKSNKPILLVEDNPSDADLTKRPLARGHISNELVIAEAGQEARDYLRGEGVYAGRAISETPSMILLDLKLPKVSGLEVLRAVRADSRLRRVPVVILTSSKEEEDVGAGY